VDTEADRLILLQKEANSPAITGSLTRRLPAGRRYLTFRYGVVRLWEVPANRVLAGGLATLPLALLCDLSTTSAENVVRSVAERIEGEGQPEERKKLWASAYLLAGLRYAPDIVDRMLEKAVTQMKESSTYQKILEDGRAEGMALGEERGREEGERALFLRLARLRLGEPSERALRVIESASRETIEVWAEALYKVETWQELIPI
jgi:predicted transposase YdaD